MIDVMFVVISGQTDPNLIPIYSLNWSPKRIVMIYTDDDMKGNAENFKASIESNSNKFVFESSIVIKDPYDINEIKEKTEERVKKYLSEGLNVVFNFSGGTKMMAIALYEVWKNNVSDKFRAIYLELFSGNLVEYKGFDQDEKIITNEHTLQIDKELSTENKFLESYFKARSLTFEQSPRDFKALPLSVREQYIKKALSQDISKSKVVHLINRVVYNENNLEIFVRKQQEHKYAKPYKEDLFSLKEVNLIEDFLKDFDEYLTVESKEIKESGKYSVRFNYTDRDEIEKFISGGWYEEACFNICKGIAGDFYSGINVKIIRNGQYSSKNELDVVFVYKKRLHIIEVKTQNFFTEETKDIPKQHIDKLINIGSDVGKNVKLCYLSYSPLAHKIVVKASESATKEQYRPKVWLIFGDKANKYDELKRSIKNWIYNK